jgi:dipeptidyl aminopeptidase/acylaminoacyl peptidase
MHGNNDQENAFEGDRMMYQALLRAGAKSVRFWEFEGVGHEAPARLFGANELPEWLFRQRR